MLRIQGKQGFGERAIFLDRDGVINVDHGYVGTWNRFDFIDGSIQAIGKLNRHGYRVIIVTNQSGIGRGYYSVDEYVQLTKLMLAEFQKKGAFVDAVYACPHYSDQKNLICNCRKPSPGMIQAGLKDHQLNADECVILGDKISDVIAGTAAGLGRCVLVTGNAIVRDARKSNIYETVSSLEAFVNTEIRSGEDCSFTKNRT